MTKSSRGPSRFPSLEGRSAARCGSDIFVRRVSQSRSHASEPACDKLRVLSIRTDEDGLSSNVSIEAAGASHGSETKWHPAADRTAESTTGRFVRCGGSLNFPILYASRSTIWPALRQAGTLTGNK